MFSFVCFYSCCLLCVCTCVCTTLTNFPLKKNIQIRLKPLPSNTEVFLGTVTWEKWLFSRLWPQTPLPQLCTHDVFLHIRRCSLEDNMLEKWRGNALSWSTEAFLRAISRVSKLCSLSGARLLQCAPPVPQPTSCTHAIKVCFPAGWLHSLVRNAGLCCCFVGGFFFL